MPRPGSRVFHAWSHPAHRPKGVLGTSIYALGLDGVGVVLGPDGDVTLGSPFPYWNIALRGTVVQWREDLIRLAD